MAFKSNIPDQAKNNVNNDKIIQAKMSPIPLMKIPYYLSLDFHDLIMNIIKQIIKAIALHIKKKIKIINEYKLL